VRVTTLRHTSSSAARVTMDLRRSAWISSPTRRCDRPSGRAQMAGLAASRSRRSPMPRGLHSFPFPLNLSLLCPFPLNLS